MNDRFEIVELWSGEFGIQRHFVVPPTSVYGMAQFKSEIVVRFSSIENAEIWMKVNAPSQIKRIVNITEK